MSSADKQFVLLVSGSPQKVSPELLWELSEGMSFVVAVDSGGQLCADAGVIPDLLIGDMDSVSAEVRAAFAEQEVEEVVFAGEKDASDLELALQLIGQRGYTDLVATNILGGRIDHELAALGSLVAAGQAGLAITVVEEGQTLIFLNNPGVRQQLQMNFFSRVEQDAAPMISLIPWGGPAVVSAKGFRWELEQAELSPNSSLGVSNYPVAATPLVELHEGALIIVVQTPAV